MLIKLSQALKKKDQCEKDFKSENGLKIHVGKTHNKVDSSPSTPDQLRQQLEGLVSLSASPLLEVSREELSSPRSPPSPHKCPTWEPCRRQKCRLRIEREKEKEALGKTCTHCDCDLYITMCCAEEKGLCDDCCNDLGVCSRMSKTCFKV